MIKTEQGARVLLSGGHGVGADTEGEALVSQHGFGVRYDLDPQTAIIANHAHDLYGESIAGRILVFPVPKGGIAASWTLADLRHRGLAPAGIIFERASPIFVQGALFAELPIMHGFSKPAYKVLATGMRVIMQPLSGCVVSA